eukprot:m.224672 g.224672  ORF g.224672 m.224672 type:complete len:497 (-) comp18772_c0_seq3:22-1512(-)
MAREQHHDLTEALLPHHDGGGGGQTIKAPLPLQQAAAKFDSDPPRRKQRSSANISGCVSNVSIAYNFGVASIASQFMQSDDDRKLSDDDDKLTADFPEPAWANYVLLGSVFAGAVVGMCLMGYLGDVLGRKKAMLTTVALTVIGALSAALLPWGNTQSVYSLICVSRFVLGMGVGGTYPLSAVTSAEGAVKGEHRGARVAWAFFWQAPGAMLPYIVASLLYVLPRHSWLTSLQFRLLFGLGAVPAAYVMYAESQKSDDNAAFQALRKSKPSPWQAAKANPGLFLTLVGTGGTWFLYDVSFYGTIVFTPVILTDIFGSDTLFDICWQSIVVTALGVPAILLSIIVLKRRGARSLQIVGFIGMALSFLMLGIMFAATDSNQAHSAKFALFCLIMFCVQFGPAVGTFVLPTEAYPSDLQSTFHGLSAASAKVGAAVGAFSFPPISGAAGIAVVLFIQATLSLCGALLTVFFVAHHIENQSKQDVDDLEQLELDAMAAQQ